MAPVVCGHVQADGVGVQWFAGTGFFVDAAHFVTAGDVIRALESVRPGRQACDKAIGIPIGGWNRESVGTDFQWHLFNCDVDDGLDLAVCKTVDTPAGVVPVTLVDTRPPDGAEVAFSGFPKGYVQPVTVRCHIAGYIENGGPEGTRQVLLDNNGQPGNSGSPIYLQDGTVIGMVVGYRDGKIGSGRSSHFILRFLRDHAVVPPK